jgi:hypothetical protein
VHQFDGRLRINARLIDAATGAEIWAELFDRRVADLFAVEDEVTRRIAIALNLAMIVAEAARPRTAARSITFCAGAPPCSSRPFAKSMRRRLPIASARWRSILRPSMRKVCWRAP